VRAYGHDLDRLLNDTQARGIDLIITPSRRDALLIQQAGDLYVENKLGYYDLFHTLTGPKLPLEELGDIARRLLDALKQPCLDGADTETWSPLPAAPGDRRSPGVPIPVTAPPRGCLHWFTARGAKPM
jgi:hypothetical protein